METVQNPPPEGEPAVKHYAESGDPHTWCGVSLADATVGELTRDRAATTCPGCIAVLVDAHLFDGDREPALAAGQSPRCGVHGELLGTCRPGGEVPCAPAFFNEQIGARPGYVAGQCGHAVALSEWQAGFRVCERCPAPAADDERDVDVDDLCDDGWHSSREEPTEPCPTCGDHAAPVAPERRTVSLEVLTDDLRGLASAPETGAVLPVAVVGVVLRVDGEAVAVPEVDAEWRASYLRPADVLERLLRQARYYADDADDAELLMPGPDVLAALEGRRTTPVSDQPTRENYVAGLRALADLIESTPDLPLPTYSLGVNGSLGGGDRQDAIDRVHRAGVALGKPVKTEVVGDNIHYTVDHDFGPVDVHLSFVAFGAVKDIARGVGEVAGSVGRSEPATEPGEWHQHISIEVPDVPDAPEYTAEVPFGPAAEQPEPQSWWFTFGSGQEFDGHFVVIYGTYDSTRDVMFAHFGNAWSMQYSSAERAGVEQFHLKELPAAMWPPRRPVVDEHAQVAGWGGEPGSCGVECACGVTYDGFDTIAEAEAQRARHAAAEQPEG